MRIAIALCVLLVLTSVSIAQDCGGEAAESCSGSQSVLRRTPVRTLIASRPVVGTFQKIRANAQSNRSARVASCSGEVSVASCSGSQAVPQMAAPCPCACQNCTCNGAASAPSQEVVSTGKRSQPRLVSSISSTYQQALASAQYRAANRIHGHSYLDTHRTSGVGWATGNSKPNTCLGGDNGSTYAVVRGSDGWYATKFQ
jgi:hypothetical protein